MKLPTFRLGTAREPAPPSLPAVAPAVAKDVGSYSLAWPSPQLFSMFGASGSSTGVPVTAISAMQAAAVYACVKRLAEDVAKLPMQLRRRLPGGGFAPDPTHPLNRLLARPNRWQTPFEFRAYMVTSLALRGNAFAVILRDEAGMPRSLIPVNWDRISVLLSPQGWLFYNVSHPLVGDGITLSQDDVIHLKNPLSLDGGYLGLSPIAMAQDVFGLALATQQHGAVLFRQGAQLGGVIKFPAKLSAEAATRIAQSWKDAYGGVQNAHKVAVLEEGGDFEKLQMTNEDAEFLATRGFQVVEICRIFGMPPHKVGDLSRATFSNIENQNQQYIDDTLVPICAAWEQRSERNLLFDFERAEYSLRVDFSELLRGDMASRFNAYAVGLNNGFLSRNEVRIREGYNPVDGGNEYRVPLNTAVSGVQATDPSDPPRLGTDPPSPKPEDVAPAENVSDEPPG